MAQLDQLVDQIAFGGKGRPTGACLGLYLSPDTVYLSEAQLDRHGRPAAQHLLRIPLPTDGKSHGSTATMSTDFLADPIKVTGAMKQSMSQMKWGAKNVRVTLSHHLGLMRYFTMPAMEPRFYATAVPLEAKKYIPIPFDVLAHDFQVLTLPADAQGKARVGILIAVTQKKNLANIQGLLDSLGLTLTGLEVAPCSVFRLLQAIDPPKGPEPFAHVHIDGSVVRIFVFDRGFPVFFREVFLNAEASLSDQRKIDLAGCVSFAQKQLGVGGISRVRISGSTPALEELRAAFAQESGVEAVFQDIPNLLSLKSGDWGGYASLGAAVPAAAAKIPPLDLAATDRISDNEHRAARDILFLGAGLAVVLAAAGLYKSVSHSYYARELQQYAVDADVAAALQGKAAADIQVQLQDMQDQVSKLLQVAGASQRPKISAVLKEIVDVMPEKVWLDRIAVSNPFVVSPSFPFEFVLRGHAQERSLAEEQALAFQFKENLIKSPLLSKIFDTQISVQTASDRGGSDAAMDSKALALKLEQRTVFTVNMRGKR